jgi:hypothetical protein
VATTNAPRKSREGNSRALLAKRAAAGAFCTLALAAAIYFTYSFFHGDTLDDAYYTTYVCTETGKSFRHKNAAGETLPIYSPYSGKNTAMPAEACFWTSDGKTKSDPTWVLLNDEVGKTGPTFCPDCGRLVVGTTPGQVRASDRPPHVQSLQPKNPRQVSPMPLRIDRSKEGTPCPPQPIARVGLADSLSSSC